MCCQGERDPMIHASDYSEILPTADKTEPRDNSPTQGPLRSPLSLSLSLLSIASQRSSSHQPPWRRKSWRGVSGGNNHEHSPRVRTAPPPQLSIYLRAHQRQYPPLRSTMAGSPSSSASRPSSTLPQIASIANRGLHRTAPPRIPQSPPEVNLDRAFQQVSSTAPLL